MNRFFLLCAACIAIISSCTEDNNFNIPGSGVTKGVVMSVKEFRAGDAVTRASISSDYKFSWDTNDLIGIYPNSGASIYFPVKDGKGAGTNTATFDGGDWALKAGATYSAFYPYRRDVNYAWVDKTAIPVSYLGQTQNGNGSTAHLGAYDYMASSYTEVDAKGNVYFNLQHLGCLVQFKLNMPKADTYSKVEITSNNVEFITEGTFDVSGDDMTIVPTYTSRTFTIALDNTQTMSDNEQLIVNTMLAPVDFSDCKLKVMVYGNKGNYITYCNGNVLTNGCTYCPDEDKEFIPYITFEAEAEQTIKLTSAIESIEYSINGSSWYKLGTNVVVFGGSHGNLRLRGKSSIGTNNSTIKFGSNAYVKCYGDIRTLVDYTNYYNTDTKNAKFIGLFKDCKQLTSAPELPATSLAYACYESMFEGCTSLTVAPELPALKMSEFCYALMFARCTSLTSAPKLQAKTMVRSCYSSMFLGCTSLTSAPTLPSKTMANSCYYHMFEECTSLVSPPELPAITLDNRCYENMFSKCTSLTSAPELPATTLAEYCYCGMFNECEKMSYIEMMALDISADNCLTDWVQGVSTSGTFVKNSAATWNVNGVNGIPSGWTVQTASK